MGLELVPKAFLRAIAAPLIAVVILLASTGIFGWILSAATPLTLAQCLLITVGTFIVAAIALEPYTSHSTNTVLAISLVTALLISTLTVLLAWPIDLLTPLSRWESCLFVLGVFNVEAYLLLRQGATAMSLLEELTSIASEPNEDPVIDVSPVEPYEAKPGRRRRRKTRYTGGDAGVV